MSILSINSRKCKLCNAKYEIVYNFVAKSRISSTRYKKMQCPDPKCGFSIAFP